MPMLDVKRAHAEVFRIRAGDTETMANGKSRPRRLLEPRVTADNPDIVRGFTGVYGGECQPWDPKFHAYEAYMKTREIRILLIPGQSLRQDWEFYQGGVCTRRCNSVTEEKSKQPCETFCPSRDPKERNKDPKQCSATTRITFICPDVPVVGAGSLISHGLVAAETLPQSVAIANAALAAGIYVPATLRFIEVKGQGTRYIIPKIEVVGTSFEELMEAGQAALALNGGVVDGAAPKILGWEPPAPAMLGSGETRTVREQMGAIEGAAPVSTRSNAQQPIPPTGLAPRTAADANVIDADSYEGGDSEAEEGDGPGAPGPHHENGGARPVNRVAIAAREAGLDDDGRHLLAEWASLGRTRSSTELTDEEKDQAIIGAGHIADGRAELRVVQLDPDNTAVTLHHLKFGWPIPPGEVANQPADPVEYDGNPDEADQPTADEIAAMKGPDLVEHLKARGLPLGGKVDELRARLTEACGHDDTAGTEPF